jgi:hypothetical protein
MPKRYRIDLVIDAKAAEDAGKRAANSMQSVADAAQKAADAAERAANKAAAAAQKAADKAVAAAQKAADATQKAAEKSAVATQQAADAAQKASDKTAAAAQKAADKAVAAAQKAADAITKAAEKKAAAVAKSLTDEEIAAKVSNARITADNKKRTMTAMQNANLQFERVAKNLTNEEIQFKVSNQKILNSNDERIRSAMKVAGVEYAGFRNGWQGADKLISSIKGLALSYVGLEGATKVLGLIKQSFNDAAESAKSAARLTTEYRAALLELAALKGQLGETGPELKSQLMFRAKTLQTREQAKEFQEEFLNVSQSATDSVDPATGKMVERNISGPEAAKLMEKSGSLQAAEGGSAKAHAQLAGMMPTLMGKRVTAEEAFAQQEKLRKISQVGGASYSSFASGIMKNSGLITSGVSDLNEVAALESAFSVSHPEGHADKVQQLMRSTKGAIGRGRGAKMVGMEGYNVQKTGAYLKDLGVTEAMSATEIARLVTTDMESGGGKGHDPMVYLGSKGYQNQEDKVALMEMGGLMKSSKDKKGNAGTFDTQFGRLAAAPASSKEADLKVAQFQEHDPVARQRKEVIGGDLASAGKGAGANEYYRSLTKNAYDKLIAEKKIVGDFDKIMGATGFDFDLNMVRQQMVEHEAADMMRVEGKRVGAKGMHAATPGFFAPRIAGKRFKSEMPAWTYEGRAEMAYEDSQKISQKGGQTLPGFDKLVHLTEKQLEAANRLEAAMRKDMERNQAPVPLPVGVNAGAGMVR